MYPQGLYRKSLILKFYVHELTVDIYKVSILSEIQRNRCLATSLSRTTTSLFNFENVIKVLRFEAAKPYAYICQQMNRACTDSRSEAIIFLYLKINP